VRVPVARLARARAGRGREASSRRHRLDQEIHPGADACTALAGAGGTDLAAGQMTTEASPGPVVEQAIEHRLEEAIEPSLPIIDPHHHVRARFDGRYLFHDYLADLASCGHNIRATIVIESGDMARADGPRELAPVGEVEFLNGVAAMFASGKYGPTLACAGIVGCPDLALGDAVRPVIEACVETGGGRFV